MLKLEHTEELIKRFFFKFYFPSNIFFIYSQQQWCELRRGRRIFLGIPKRLLHSLLVVFIEWRSKKAKGNWRKNLTCLFNLVKRLRCSRISMIHDIALPSLSFFISSHFLFTYCWFFFVYARRGQQRSRMECSWAAFRIVGFYHYFPRNCATIFLILKRKIMQLSSYDAYK